MVTDEDLINILTQINQWISNCDTKSSILLTLIGIIIGVIFSNNYAYKLVSIYTKTNMISLEFVIYSIVLLITTLILLKGIIHIILSISPDFNITPSNKDSLIFYASISKQSSQDYEHAITNPEYDFDGDIISQIHINADICTKKFKNYKTGLKDILIGFILLTILIIIRYTVYSV